MTKINAVIFDFDGVILDSEGIRYKTYKTLFKKEYNIELPLRDLNILGRSTRDNLRYFLKKYNLEGDIDNLAKKREKILKKTFSKKINLIPMNGIFNLVQDLKNRKLTLAIASSSSKKHIKKIIKILKLNNYFDIIIGSEDVIHHKPAPDIFIKTANSLNIERENCIIIEDSLNGIIAAKNAGIKVIALTSSLPKEMLTEADFIVNNLESIGNLEIFNV